MQAHPLIHGELARQREIELRNAGGKPRRQDSASHELAPVVTAARSGDEKAWESLVRHFTPVLQGVVRGYRLSTPDVEDVVQSAWMSAFSHIGSLREPDAIGGWLCVIARREAVRTLERRRHEVLVEESGFADQHDGTTPESAVLEAEGRHAVGAAIERLSDRQRAVLSALLSESAGGYAEVAHRLGMPIGAIGPTRDRALARLRRDRVLVAAVSSRSGELSK